MTQSINPMHVQVALQEATTQLQLLSSRGQQLAVELFESRQMNAALSQELQELRSKMLAPEAQDQG